MVYTIEIALHFQNISIYACIYCKGRLERYWSVVKKSDEQKVGWVTWVVWMDGWIPHRLLAVLKKTFITLVIALLLFFKKTFICLHGHFGQLATSNFNTRVYLPCLALPPKDFVDWLCKGMRRGIDPNWVSKLSHHPFLMDHSARCH